MNFEKAGDWKDGLQQTSERWGETMAKNAAAAGDRHAAGLRADGTQLFTGDQDICLFGFCTCCAAFKVGIRKFYRSSTLRDLPREIGWFIIKTQERGDPQ